MQNRLKTDWFVNSSQTGHTWGKQGHPCKMHLCMDSSKRRTPGSPNGEGEHLEEKKPQGYVVISIISEKCVGLPGFINT